MKQIGFKNYKRFKELMPLDLGRLTVIVGANNSGKSTFLKGLLLARENTVNLTLPQSYGGKERFDGFMHPIFSFDLNHLNAGISNFKRSLTYNAGEQDMKFFISLPLVTETQGITAVDSMNIGFEIEFTIKSDTIEDAERGIGLISALSIVDLGRQFYYNFDFVKGVVSFEIKKHKGKGFDGDVYKYSSSSIFSKCVQEVEALRNSIDEAQYYGSETFFKTQFRLKNYVRNRKEDDGIFTYSAIAKYVENIAEIIIDLLGVDEEEEETWFNENNAIFSLKSKDDIENFEVKEALMSLDMDIVSAIKKSAKALDLAVTHENRIMYLPIHSINRQVLYNANDKNDFVAQSIRQYMLASFNRNNKREMKSLVIKWMRKFEIGESFTIKNVEGEYYSFKVQKSDKTTVNLADLGTGSIQLIAMFLNIASIINRNLINHSDFLRERGHYANIPTIIIEEPEQNLHPKFQSRLADFFTEVSQGLNVIIETHSEYLIRRMQVIQAESYKESIENSRVGLSVPFSVYYFPNDDAPYDMKMKPDGWFEEKFDEGFLDVADKAHIQMLGMNGGINKKKK